MLGNGLPEDQCAWAFDFRMMTPTSWWRVPFGMNIAGLPQNARAEYRVHKMMLQQLQYARPQKYWVLKGFHGSRLAELFDNLCGREDHLDPSRSGAGARVAYRDHGRDG